MVMVVTSEIWGCWWYFSFFYCKALLMLSPLPRNFFFLFQIPNFQDLDQLSPSLRDIPDHPPPKLGLRPCPSSHRFLLLMPSVPTSRHHHPSVTYRTSPSLWAPWRQHLSNTHNNFSKIFVKRSEFLCMSRLLPEWQILVFKDSVNDLS